MGSASSAPPPPDTSEYSDALMGDANLMRDWAQSMWDNGQEEMARIGAYAQDFMSMTLPASEELFDWARTQRQRFDEFVMPQMESLFREAELYASKGEEDRQRGMAIQDIKSATEAQREAQLRKLEGYGVDPSDTRYMAMDKQAGVAEAALSALAANQAGERTKQIGRDMRTEAIGLGTGFLSDAQASGVNAANIGVTGANVGNAAANTGIALQQAPANMLAGAGNATSTAAGIVDTSYGRDLDYAVDQRAAEAADAQGMGGIGNMIGAGLALTPYGMAAGSVTNVLSGALQANSGGAEGGVVRVATQPGYAAEGGPVAAPGGPTSDGGALRISDGEYIIPADVVQILGTKHFDKMIEKETGRPPPGPKMAIPVGAV